MESKNINDLVEKVNIVDIINNFSPLTKAGASFKTLCNVHGDTTPSLSINPKKQIYKCFVCDHGGNALDYLMWAQKFSFKDAIEYLIKESGENLDNYQSILKTKKRNQKELDLLKALSDANNFFNYSLNISLDEQDGQISSFVQQRKLTRKLINKFKLGYAPSFKESNYLDLLIKKNNSIPILINSSITNEDGTKPFFSNKLIFPIFNEENEVVAFSGRKINNQDEGPKYLNSKESLVFKKNEVIYNYNNAKKFDQLILVEGFMDVIAFAKIGKENAIALMGISLSKEHVSKFKKHKEILIFLDNDSAGIEATLKVVKVFLLNNINAFVINNQEQKDPDEIVNGTQGKEKLLSLLNNKIKMVDFVFESFMDKAKNQDMQQLKKSIIEIAKFSKSLDDFFKLEIINKIASRFDLKKDIVIKYFENHNNVIKLKEFKNINTKKSLEIEFNKPLNINKLLISIWQNPVFLKSQNLVDFVWPEVEFRNIYTEIRDFYEHDREITSKTKDFLDNLKKVFKSKESLPKDMESFEELISRSKKDSMNVKIKHMTKTFRSSNSQAVKEEILKRKLEILSKKGK